MNPTHTHTWRDGTRTTRLPVGYAEGSIYVCSVAVGEDLDETWFPHVRMPVRVGDRVLESFSGGGGGSDEEWLDHRAFEWTFEEDRPVVTIDYVEDGAVVFTEDVVVQR